MIPLLVCDDSAMARKQLIRALPADWPVSITQAAHGEEALAAIRQGLGPIMLLDLTMPVLDGYQTLAALQAEGLQSQVIVVSGDVQDEAVRRVRELGALDFLKNPPTPRCFWKPCNATACTRPPTNPVAPRQRHAPSWN